MKRFFAFTFILVLVLLSCEKEVILEFDHEPKLCLNCILNPDSIIKARLTLSKKLDNSDSFIPVQNATLYLYEEGVLFGKLNDAGLGNYKLDKKPKEGRKYNIVANSIGYESINATTIVPDAPEIIYSKDTLGYNEYNMLEYNLKIQIYDQPGKDYYWIFGSRSLNGVKYGGGNRSINAPFVDDFNKTIDIEAKYGFTFFLQIRITDEGYDGQILDFVIPNYVVTDQHNRFYQHFLKADEHYDKYIKTTIINRMKENSELPFFEPVQVYSNIENGYGIFGSCAITTINL